jgi:hypothetical protein
VVGRTLRLNGDPHTVVGVLPPTFDFSSTFTPTVDVDVLVPFVVSTDNNFQGNVLALIGRLRPGKTAARRMFGGERQAIGGRLEFWGPWVCPQP